jgi:hypothetical protein
VGTAVGFQYHGLQRYRARRSSVLCLGEPSRKLDILRIAFVPPPLPLGHVGAERGGVCLFFVPAAVFVGTFEVERSVPVCLSCGATDELRLVLEPLL